MTPEQLEAIEGIGPKTVEKISLAVNNYFASLEAGAVEGEAPAEGDAATEAAAEQLAGDIAADEEAAAPEVTADVEAASTEKEEHEPKDGSASETNE
jgi:N utilization substance protein A